MKGNNIQSRNSENYHNHSFLVDSLARAQASATSAVLDSIFMIISRRHSMLEDSWLT